MYPKNLMSLEIFTPTQNVEVTGNIYAKSNIVVTGNVHATRYYGDGGLLSNITLQVVSDKGNINFKYTSIHEPPYRICNRFYIKCWN